jgi:type I restriction enzyme S subunit
MTRGLAPYVPLRESGLPWLGEIPAHWDIWKVGHFAAVGNGFPIVTMQLIGLKG